MDLGFKGPAYTWTNKRSTSGAIFESLDRDVATVEWLTIHAEAYVTHLPRRKSDHAAIMLRLRVHQSRQRKFKMEPWWFGVEGFREVWEEIWQGTRNMTWQERVGLMNGKIRNWERNYRSPQNRLKEAESELYRNQTLYPLFQDPRIEEEYLKEINKAEEELDVYWRQRAKAQWACQEDRNTAFFHTAATNRRRRNMILIITNEQGEWVTSEA